MNRIVSVDYDWRHIPHSFSPLGNAIRSGNTAEVKRLVEAGVSLDATQFLEWTPLHVAALNDDLADIVEILLAAGANIEHHGLDGDTPLFIACRYSSAEIVRVLLSHGCAVNSGNAYKVTPLHAACLKRNVTIVNLLVEAGANVNARDDFGMTPLFIACKYSSEEIVRLLLSHCSIVNTRNRYGVTPLHVACSKENINIIVLLIQAGANLDAKDSEGSTPLYYAIECSNLTAVKLLIHNGCNLNMEDYFNKTPLRYSCMVGNVEIFDILIESLGVDFVNKRTSDGWTLLMEAVDFEQFSLVKKLIDLGADTSPVNSDGRLALHLACSNLPCFRLLFAHTETSIIEQYGTEKGNLIFASLPCSLIANDMYEGLCLLVEKEVSDAVLGCPIRVADSLFSPLSFLFMDQAMIPDRKIRYVQLLLKRETLKDTLYVSDLRTVRPVEALIRFQSGTPDCELLLKLLLKSGLTPDYPALDIPPAFVLCLESGVITNLALLLAYTNSVTPERLLSFYLTSVLTPGHAHTEEEEPIIQFLSALTCDFSQMRTMLKSAVRNSGLDPRARLWCQSIIVDASTVRSLKSLSRHFVRKDIMGKGLILRQTLSCCDLPKSLLQFLMYDEL